MYDIFDPATGSSSQPGALASKVLVSLSSDTPDASREASDWASQAQSEPRDRRRDGARSHRGRPRGIRLPKAVKAHYDQAIAAGRDTENWTVLYEMPKAGY
ncbi:Putative dehydrogenase; putative signal peptide [Frankia alni ACN14a]|uniref:Dehydrogenase putative signal peptide n=1 Tax=Frankia alni (strain DSM 45986 / CECT 9034 / ACN14a) TaxID=326424 RepID=Q0RUB4_FRAAA|nr:Putative dehydrogenase; putative signal peptide [Frankia alni ACN14a]